jgi:hypothetical protein
MCKACIRNVFFSSAPISARRILLSPGHGEGTNDKRHGVWLLDPGADERLVDTSAVRNTNPRVSEHRSKLLRMRGVFVGIAIISFKINEMILTPIALRDP